MGDLRQFAKGYRILAELGYRPAAPSDGHGTITVPLAELDLEAEARAYAQGIEEMDRTGRWVAGRTNARTAPGAVLVLEALRLMNAGLSSAPDSRRARLVPAVLRRAAEEYENAVRAQRRRDN